MVRTIAVTGSASGIGKATAEILEERGDTVIRIDLTEGDITGDLGNPEEVSRVAQEIVKKSGGTLDGLVANAGVTAGNSLSLKINYFGTVQLIEELVPALAKSDNPRVSITTSAATLQGNDPELVDLLLNNDVEGAIERGDYLGTLGPQAGYANYSSSKRAISRWVRRVASTDKYAGQGIGINAVGPGQVRTGMTKELFASEEGRKQAADAMPTPYNGIADPEHIGVVHAFLQDPRNARMTGQVFFVDGGYDALRRGDDIFTSVE
ncbi:SDR family oxidoreductase [Corynebacterium lubricantis]|uniref:SDR family oxidoreductase n=1 Tax=Corynebacterium lubricantis TaxID=541095 RepID=UPI00035F975C|nr:SDR family oxidoreductase [Corynebacterium lubricantis]